MASLPVIAVSVGDVAGIGPEVTLKALASARIPRCFRYLILGDVGVVEQTQRRWKLEARFELMQPTVSLPKIPWGRHNRAAARAAHEWIETGARLCMDGRCAALVTAPVNKEAMNLAGLSFRGSTELLARITGTKTFAMMMHSSRLKVALATNHLALRDVAKRLSANRIWDVARLTCETLGRLGVARPLIAVAGVNPHNGEGGAFGDEEKRVIAPAVAMARQRGLAVTGPIPGDTVFRRAYQGEFDAVIAMYHDQGLAPLKIVAFDEAVNLTMGLPIVRTSPDHGTAYDIAGKGIARPESMIAAINLAAKLTRT